MSSAPQIRFMSGDDFLPWSDFETGTTVSESAGAISLASRHHPVSFHLCKIQVLPGGIATAQGCLSEALIKSRPALLAPADKGLWLQGVIPSSSESETEIAESDYCLHLKSSRGFQESWIGGIVEVFKELLDLSGDDAEDVEGFQFKPTEHAFAMAAQILVKAAVELGSQMPKPYISPDGQGGIRIEWAEADREVRLSCSSNQKTPAYIYHQEKDDYAVDYAVTAKHLAAWLRWLLRS